MEKWKIGVIIVLLGALAGYGFYQQNTPQTSPEDQPDTQPTPTATPPKISRLKGKTAPAWNFPQSNWVNTPQPILPSDMKGKVVLLEFWRIGCSHCEEAAPFMERLSKEYSSRGVRLVSIHSPGAPGPANPENDWTNVQRTIKSWGITYPVAFDEGGKLFKETYGGDTYPTLFLLDRAGKIIFVMTGHTPQKEREIRAELNKALKSK